MAVNVQFTSLRGDIAQIQVVARGLETREMDEWLGDPERIGRFWSFLNTAGRAVYLFDNENLAFEFRMRWG